MALTGATGRCAMTTETAHAAQEPDPLLEEYSYPTMFGDAEVFSLTPTKVLVAGEGGLVATNDASLAKSIGSPSSGV